MDSIGAVPLLADDHAAFVQGGVSIVAASCDAANLPSIGRVTGCAVTPDRRRVTVFVAARQAPALIADVRANGRIAVVFAKPTTHRSLQLKGEDAALRALAPGEPALVARYVEAFGREIAHVGHGPDYARVLFAHVEGDLQAIDFTPAAAFEQTPGPNAGAPIPRPR